VGPDSPYLVGGIGALVLGCAIPLIIPPAVRVTSIDDAEDSR
jgi:hypothetical protein